jgi:hypothetical protein
VDDDEEESSLLRNARNKPTPINRRRHAPPTAMPTIAPNGNPSSPELVVTLPCNGAVVVVVVVVAVDDSFPIWFVPDGVLSPVPVAVFDAPDVPDVELTAGGSVRS